MNIVEFNKKDIKTQVCLMNDYLQKFGSLRSACVKLNVNKSTIQSRFKRAGYLLKDNHYECNKSVELLKPVEKKVQTSEKVLTDELSDLKIHENSIFKSLSSIASHFLKIGAQLDYIQYHKLYKQAKYESLTDYAFSVFKMKKTAVYNLINVYHKFSVDGELKKQYTGFTYSQLVELVNAPSEIIDSAKTTDTVKQIREKKKANKIQPKKQIRGQTTVDDFTQISTSAVRPKLDVSKYQEPLINILYILDDIQKEHNTALCNDAKLLEKIMNIRSILQNTVSQLNDLKK